MRPSFYTDIILLIACILFIFSLANLLIRLEIHFNSFQSQQTFFIYNSYPTSTTLPRIRNVPKKLMNFTGQPTKDLSLRQKVLGTNSNNHSIFHRFEFINPPKSVCTNLQNLNNSMIIVVLSRALNLDYRQAIRATWGRNEKYKSSNITIQTIFFVGVDDSVHSSIRNEQMIFNDIIEINIPENQPFVAHKELAALFWLRLYCPLARILFRIDDDLVLDIFLLLNHLEHQINFNSKDGIYGWFQSNNNTVLRSGKSAVTKREYNEDIYPPYTLSTGYLLSNDSCQRLIQVANHPKHYINRLNNVYITGILRDLAQIQFYTYSNLEYLLLFSNEVSCAGQFEKRSSLLVCTSQLHLGIHGNSDEYYDIWDGLLVKHNTSLLTF